MRLRSATYKLGLITSLLAAATAAGIVCAQVPGGCNTPVSQRTGEAGCYLTATELLGALPQAALFWHLYAYPTHAAAESAKGSRGTVVESFGKVWLYTIADSEWRASSGEAVFPPGMRAAIHRHSGPEAWYLLSGAQCLETPEGITVARTGEGAVVPEGPPMALSSVGTETRRSVLLVLHDTSQPWITIASDWQPRGSCPK